MALLTCAVETTNGPQFFRLRFCFEPDLCVPGVSGSAVGPRGPNIKPVKNEKSAIHAESAHGPTPLSRTMFWAGRELPIFGAIDENVVAMSRHSDEHGRRAWTRARTCSRHNRPTNTGVGPGHEPGLAHDPKGRRRSPRAGRSPDPDRSHNKKLRADSRHKTTRAGRGPSGPANRQ